MYSSIVIISIEVTTETPLTNIKRLKRSKIWQLDWCCQSECLITQPNWLKLRKTYSSVSTFIHTNQWEWWRRIETILTNVNRLKRGQIVHFKWLGILECVVIQFDWLKLRKSYPWVLSLSPYQSPKMRLLRWNNNFLSQWIEVKWDLSLRVLWHPWMHCHPI